MAQLAQKPDIQLDMRSFQLNADAIGRIYAVGHHCHAVRGQHHDFCMNLILMQFSSTAVAVFGVYFKLQSFVFMPVFGLNNGTVPIMRLQLRCPPGRPGANKTIRLAAWYATAIMLVGFAVQFLPGAAAGAIRCQRR